MRILVTGAGGKAGSWQIRGEQLGAAMGAEVMPFAETAEFRRAQIVVVVKRTPAPIMRPLRASGKPWILDLVDGWPQPDGNEWNAVQARRWLRYRLEDLGPAGVVFPTTRALEDSGWQGPALVLPHHAWTRYEPRPLAECVTRIGYEGDPRYLGPWRSALEAACARRGWRLEVNGDLSACDAGIALRAAQGYPCGAWKANTKLANLQALGIPAICSPEESYREFGSGREILIDGAAELELAFDAIADRKTREEIRAAALAAAPRLDRCAKRFREWLCASRF